MEHDDAVPEAAPSVTEETEELGLWQVIAPVNGQVRTAMAISAVGTLAWFVSLLALLPVATELVSPEIDATRVWQFLALSGAGVVAAFVARVLAFRLAHLAAYRLEEILRTEMADHLARVPLGYVVTTGSGALKKVLMDDVRALHAFVADSTPLFAKTISAPVIGVVVLFLLDWRLALIGLAIIPIGAIAMFFAFRDYEEARRSVDEANERINSVINEYIQGMQVVRTFDDGTGSFRRYRTALHDSTEMLREWTARTQTGAYVAKTLFAALPSVLVLLPFGVVFVNAGTLDVSTLLGVLIIAPVITDAVVPIIWLQQHLNEASAAVKRLGQLRAVEPLVETLDGQTPAESSIEFRNVTFRYGGRDNDALRDVSFVMPAGTVTALVGSSGAGKSTVAQLVPRFWDVDTGAVLIGGVDVRDMTADTLMEHVSFVFQAPFLLHDTVAANIRLGRPEASEAEVVAAATAAQAHEFITHELPDGYDTVVGERGTSLSGGQRQRITIARAILQDTPIVVLDEATAFADPDNEVRIHEALVQLIAGKTLLIVAHRLSTIVDADQVVVLDKGEVVESGTHDELVAASGRYAALWDHYQKGHGWELRKTESFEEVRNA